MTLIIPFWILILAFKVCQQQLPQLERFCQGKRSPLIWLKLSSPWRNKKVVIRKSKKTRTIKIALLKGKGNCWNFHLGQCEFFYLFSSLDNKKYCANFNRNDSKIWTNFEMLSDFRPNKSDVIYCKAILIVL